MDLLFNEQNEDTLCITLTDDLDITESNQFKTDVLQKTQGKKNIIFDLSKVEYIDSSGLSAFISIKKELDKNNTCMKITNVDEIVKSVFKVTKLHTFFNFDE